MIIIATLFMFLGISIFRTLPRAHFTPSPDGSCYIESESDPKPNNAHEHKLYSFIVVIILSATKYQISSDCRSIL